MKTAMSMTLMEMEHVPDVVATCPNNLYESPVRGMDPRPLKYRMVAYASFKKRLSSQHSGEGDEAERRGSGPTVVAAYGCIHGLSRWEAYGPVASPWFPVRRIIDREQYPVNISPGQYLAWRRGYQSAVLHRSLGLQRLEPYRFYSPV